MKKNLSIITAFIMILSFSTTAFAMDKPEFQEEITHINEYDYIVMLQNSTPEELSKLNMTKSDVAATVRAFYKAISERAKLSDEALFSYGYNSKEISIFRDFSSVSKITTKGLSNIITTNLRAISGTLTGKIKLNSCGTKRATFRYEWFWDHDPILKLIDSAAMRWLAYDSKGHGIDVIKVLEASRIDYYTMDDKFAFSQTGTPETNLSFNSVNIQFDVIKYYTPTPYPKDAMTSAYAKKGSVTIGLKVDGNVKNNINYIKVAALYGHTVIGISAPSISLSSTGTISIGFSGNQVVENLGGHKVKIGKGSTITTLK